MPLSPNQPTISRLACARFVFLLAILLPLATSQLSLLFPLRDIVFIAGILGLLATYVIEFIDSLLAEIHWPSVLSRSLVFVLGLTLVIVLRFALYGTTPQPALGHEDQGVYSITAIQGVRTGSFHLDVPPTHGMPDRAVSLFTIQSRSEAIRESSAASSLGRYLYPTFRVNSEGTAAISHFPPGQTIALGAFFRIGGWGGIGVCNGLFTLMGALCLGIILVRWVGPVAGISAFCLALFNPLSVWITNTAFAEPLAQMLWLSGLVVLTARAKIDTREGGLIGFCFGLVPMVKFDGFALICIPVLLALWWWRPRRDIAYSVVFGWALGTSLVVINTSQTSGSYVIGSLYGLLSNVTLNSAIFIVVFGVVASVTTKAFLARRVSQIVALEQAPFAGQVAAAVLLILGCLYFAIVRPLLTTPDSFYYWPTQSKIPSMREQTFLRIGWYVENIGLAAAIAGCSALIFRTSLLFQFLFLSVGGATLALVCFDILNYPTQPYAMRRIIIFGLPLIVAGLSVWWLVIPQRFPKLRIGVATLSLFALLVAHHRLNHAFSQRSHQEGILAGLDQLADKIPPGAIIIMNRGEQCSAIAPYLQASQGIQSVCHVPSPFIEDKALWPEVINAWLRQGRRVIYLSQQSRSPLVPVQHQQPIGWGSLRYWTLVSRVDRLPDAPEQRIIPWVLIELFSQAPLSSSHGGAPSTSSRLP